MPDRPNEPSSPDTSPAQALRDGSRRAAGAQLRRYRTAAGLTQDHLAEAAGIATRTLRSIESGVLRPRRATITQLASALDLTDRAGFVALWHGDDDGRELSDDGLLSRPGGLDRLLTPAARHARTIEWTVMNSDRSVVGPGRNIDQSHLRFVTRALADGLDRTTVVVHTPQVIDWERLTTTDLDNCTLQTATPLPSASAAMFELRYGTVLHAGEIYTIGGTVDFAAARVADAAHVPCTEAGIGVRRAGTTVSIQVTFPVDDLPTQVSYEFTERIYTEPLRVEPLRVSSHGSTQILIEKADVGMHSITWSWSD